MSNANDNRETTLEMSQVPDSGTEEVTSQIPQLPVSSAKEALEVFKSINRSRLITAPQMTLGLKLLGYVPEEFESGILQGYLEAIGHPVELRKGKLWFVF